MELLRHISSKMFQAVNGTRLDFVVHWQLGSRDSIEDKAKSILKMEK
jgi:hypothetical protein